MEQVTIIGPGLLGASLGEAIRNCQLASRIAVWARRPESRHEAAERSWCDTVYETPEEAVTDADFVIICTPVESIEPMVARIKDHLQPRAIVTDVGSTKSLICRRCSHILRSKECAFVGSHPMAGSEKTGMQNARSDLFRGKACLITPLEDTHADAVDLVVRFWRALEMIVTTLTPEQHDEIVAHVSHLPHVLASVLSAQLGTHASAWRQLSGTGLADTTRIAAGSPHLWLSIFQQNREEVLRALNAFSDELQEFHAALTNQDWYTVLNTLQRGKTFRDKLPQLRGEITGD